MFAGRAVIEFVRLSGTVEELRTIVQIREEFNKEQQRKEEEKERARVAREEEERNAEAQRREALMIDYCLSIHNIVEVRETNEGVEIVINK